MPISRLNRKKLPQGISGYPNLNWNWGIFWVAISSLLFGFKDIRNSWLFHWNSGNFCMAIFPILFGFKEFWNFGIFSKSKFLKFSTLQRKSRKFGFFFLTTVFSHQRYYQLDLRKFGFFLQTFSHNWKLIISE